MLVVLIFFSLAQTEVLNGHVKVDLILSRFGERTQGIVDMMTQFACFLLLGLVTWSALVYSEKMRASGEVSQDLWIPVYPFIYTVAVGCGILALTMLIKFFMALTKTLKS
jgi:TRAP-type C4-dicarboxylate transport system permease small subunit